jgi:hypothetical protein
VSQPGVRRVVLLAPTTVTTSAAFPDINIPQGFSTAIVSATASTTSGTSPTFALFLQKQIPQAASTDLAGNPPSGTAVWDDVLQFTTITTNSTRIANLAGISFPATTANTSAMTTADWALTDAGIGSGTLRIGALGGDMRVKVAVTGTSPSTVLSVVAEFIPYGG